MATKKQEGKTPETKEEKKTDQPEDNKTESTKVATTTPKKKGELMTSFEKKMIENTTKRINGLVARNELSLPADYSADNAIRAAAFALQKKIEYGQNKGKSIAEVCDDVSIFEAIEDMVFQGLDSSLNQCYFIPYANQCTLIRSYHGTQVAAKRLAGVEDTFAQCVYESDELKYEMENAQIKNIHHIQDISGRDGAIMSAYAAVIRPGKEPYFEVMTIQEIRKAWGQGAAKGDSPAHKSFPQEMAKKTVINRALKKFVNTSGNNAHSIQAFERTTENEYKVEKDKIIVDASFDIEDTDEIASAEGAIFGDTTPEILPESDEKPNNDEIPANDSESQESKNTASDTENSDNSKNEDMPAMSSEQLEFIELAGRCEKGQSMSFDCPICGGTAHSQRAATNGHVHALCDKCGFALQQ